MEDFSEQSIRQNCPHCTIGGHAFNTILLRTNDFSIVTDSHPIVEGHLLIIPKRHVSCIGEYRIGELEEFKSLYATAKEFVANAYGGVATFEHGVIGQTVFHSHVHILPFAGPPEHIVPEGPDKLTRIAGIDDLPALFQSNGKYLFFSIGAESWSVNTSLGAPRFFRDRFAAALGRPERGNWKSMHAIPALMDLGAQENRRCELQWKEFATTHSLPHL